MVSKEILGCYLPFVSLMPYNIAVGNSVMAENAIWYAFFKKMKNISVKLLSDCI
jgi:hypothetical protein